ncbi:hypothetical protein F53441_12589 [Fusarium austroafricanum]|uniref:BTB domain-containing protein n=1 Tax=Fusarium austroafricanum TaxID=2364996 RepID=A0A8H4JXA5_9HYPO|nr:hypothetical protein F53441_12589 [Fusarium austroafricanum]
MAQAPKPDSHSRAPSSTGRRYRDANHVTINEYTAISFHAALSNILCSEKFSDMTIICGEREFKAHRAIVCTQSSFFDKAMSGNFKEAASRSVELPDDDPDVVEGFLEFLYTGTYSDGVNSTWGKLSAAATLDPETDQENLQTLACGDLDTTVSRDGEENEPDEEYNEYQEESLQEDNEGFKGEQDGRAQQMQDLANLPNAIGKQKLADLCDDMILSLRLYVMADKYDVPVLRLLARDRFYHSAKVVWKEAECFPAVVDELYETAPPTDIVMKEIVCRLVAASLHDRDVRDKMRPVMIKHGEFAVGVMDLCYSS